MLIGAVLVFAQPGTGLTSLGGSSGSNPITNTLLGFAIGFIGFIVLIAGLAASANPGPTVVQYVPPSTFSSPSQRDDQQYDVRPRAVRSTSQPRPDASDSPSSHDADSGFCPYCGKPTLAGHEFCRSCGHALDE